MNIRHVEVDLIDNIDLSVVCVLQQSEYAFLMEHIGNHIFVYNMTTKTDIKSNHPSAVNEIC
jgi:hypothetical protein